MKNKNQNILIVLILIFTIVFIYYLRINLVRNRTGNNLENKIEEIAIVDLSKDKFEPKENKNLQLEEKEHTEEEKIVTLIVSDKIYEIRIDENESLYEMMINLENKNANNFSFNYKNYPSLGIFINEINGQKAGSGKYWIYSVNGKEATTGVSNYILKEGDIINWELK
jgi:hypothetical protein